MLKRGFTLIEMMVYIAMMTIILTVGIYFIWQLIESKTKNISYLEAERNLNFVLEKISYEAKAAKSIKLPQIQGQETKELILLKPDNSLIRFYLDGGKIFLTTSSQPHVLTSLTTDRVFVSSLIFKNLSSILPGAFQVQIKIKHYNPSQRNEYRAEFSIQKTIALRHNNE